MSDHFVVEALEAARLVQVNSPGFDGGTDRTKATQLLDAYKNAKGS